MKSNCIELSDCFKDGDEFTARGITFNNICMQLKEKVSRGNLDRLKEIKKELVNLESEGIVEYLLGEPPYYVLKDTIKYHGK